MRSFPLTAACLLLWAAALVHAGMTPATQQPPDAAITETFRPPPPPEQPIPYSHRTHLALGLQCAGCHETAASAARATIPATSTCMGCHDGVRTESPHIQALKAWDDKKEPVPWRRVYRLPTFVDFSHARHVADAQLTCDVCHGDVSTMDQMQKVRDITMAACIECHKSRSAPARCDSCHEPL
jgi:predicted CXXCH cytochrome family protein